MYRLARKLLLDRYFNFLSGKNEKKEKHLDILLLSLNQVQVLNILQNGVYYFSISWCYRSGQREYFEHARNRPL